MWRALWIHKKSEDNWTKCKTWQQLKVWLKVYVLTIPSIHSSGFILTWLSVAKSKRADPVLNLWLVTCFSYVLCPKCGFVSVFVCCEIKKRPLTYAPDALNLSQSCHLSFHKDLAFTPHLAEHHLGMAWRPLQGNTRVHSHSARQIHSQPDTQNKPKHQTRTTCRSSLSNSPTESPCRKGIVIVLEIIHLWFCIRYTLLLYVTVVWNS